MARESRIGIWFAVLVPLVVVVLGIWMHLGFIRRRVDREATRVARDLADHCRDVLLSPKASGAVWALGTANQRIKGVLQGHRVVDDESLVGSLSDVKRALGASIVYVVDTNGQVVACSPYDEGKTLTGNNYKFRPYVVQALAGSEAAYFGIGVTTHVRGLYYSAPVYKANCSKTNEALCVIGVVVAKMPPEPIDKLLASRAEPAALVMPEGVVFSASEPDWLLKVVDKESWGRMRAASGSRREYLDYSFYSEDSLLPEAVRSTEEAVLGEREMSVSVRSLELGDIGGPWQLRIYRSTDKCYSRIQQVILLVVLLVVCGLSFWVIYLWRRRHEAELRRDMSDRDAAETYRAIFDSVSDAIVVLDEHTHSIKDVNANACGLFGLTREELCGAESWEDLPFLDDCGRKALLQTGKGDSEFECRARDGAGNEVWTWGTVHRCSIQGCSCIQVVLRDITANKDARDDLERRRADLERRVEQRTTQLLQSQKMAAVGQLAYRVTHEFTNALTMIMGRSLILKKTLADRPSVAADLEEIVAACDRVAMLNAELLAFAKPTPSPMAPTPIKKLMKGFEALAHRVMRDSTVIKMALSNGHTKVNVSVSQMEQVMMHLLLNANEAMNSHGELTIGAAVASPEQEIRSDAVGVSSVPHMDAAMYVEISVADNGHGMNEDTRHRAFEPFFSTHDDKSRGMGLATVYTIMEQHSGYVSIDSIEGKGTTVRLYIPVALTGSG